MSSIVIAGDTSGSVTLQAPAVAGSTVLNLPSTSGTIQTSGAGYTTNGVAYATSTSALSTGSNLSFDGTSLSLSGNLVTQTSSAATAAGQWGYNSTYGSYIYAKGGTTANFAIFTNSGANGVLMDSAGNLGLGVTPSAWLSGWKAIEMQGGSLLSPNSSYMNVVQNAYYDGGWKYKNTAAASNYYQNAGAYYWMTAPSGTAGTAITFTQAMTLDASGNLLVGTTTAGDGARFTVTRTSVTTASLQQTDSNYACAEIVNSGAAGTRYLLSFRKVSGGANLGTITHDGSNTAYNTSSDYRLKENIAPMTGALTTIAQLKPCTYTWKVDGASGQGFIAHELQEVVPDAVTGEKDAVDEDGNPVYQGIDTSFLVATLTAALQEAHELIKSLETRISALETK